MFWIQSCKHSLNAELRPTISEICSPDTVYFVEQVLPLLEGCAISGCHSGTLAQEGVKLNNYSDIIHTGGVIRGNANGSAIIEVLQGGGKRMPPYPRSMLSQESIDWVKKWIDQGALNNSCPNIGCDVDSVSYSNDIFPLINNYCTYCHQGNSPDGSIKMTNYDEIVVMCARDNFINIIQDYGNPMPKNSQGLTPCQVEMFQKWIDYGLPNN